MIGPNLLRPTEPLLIPKGNRYVLNQGNLLLRPVGDQRGQDLAWRQNHYYNFNPQKESEAKAEAEASNDGTSEFNIYYTFFIGLI